MAGRKTKSVIQTEIIYMYIALTENIKEFPINWPIWSTTLHETDQSPKSQKADTQRWNKVLSEWKEKIGQSTFIPSGTNFFDIAEMAEMLNAEK